MHRRKIARILIVDDEEPFREILAAVLNHYGSYECRHVPSGVDALRLLDAGEKFDLVTCDIMNIPMGGFEFLKQMGKRFPKIPVLVITASRNINTPHYLHKDDCGGEKLLAAVQSAIS